MTGFIKHSIDGTQEVAWIDASHPDILEPAEEGFVWTEVPEPAAEWAIAVVDDEIRAVPRLKPMSRLIAMARVKKWEEIKAVRAERLKTAAIPGVGLFDADETALQNIRTKIEVLDRRRRPATTLLNWRLSTNEWAEITLKQLKDVRAAISDHRDAIMATSFAIEEQINDPSATLEQIEAIGWPD